MTRRFEWRRLLVVFGTLLLSGVFLLAGVSKISDLPEFAKIIGHFHILPTSVESLAAHIIVYLELIVGLTIWIPSLKEPSLYLIATMLVVFFVALSSAVVRGLDVSCGCFGAWSPESQNAALGGLIRDGFLLAVAYLLGKDARTQTASLSTQLFVNARDNAS